MKRLSRITALLLSLVISVALAPRPSVAQQQTAAATATDYSAPLAAIEKAIDDKRKELGIQDDFKQSHEWRSRDACHGRKV